MATPPSSRLQSKIYKLFGSAVDIEGDSAVIGSSNDSFTAFGAGSAYVFRRSGVVWAQEQKLLAADGEAYDEFGVSVAISGDAVLVGARLDDGTYANSGSAYVYRYCGVSWAGETKLTSSTAGSSTYFGTWVDIDGDIALVGEPSNGGGSADVFHYDVGSASWTGTDVLTDPVPGSVNDYFGQSVSLSGGKALVGAWGDGDTGIGPGSAFVVGLGCQGGCGTVSATLGCVPDSGVLPFNTLMTVTLGNNYGGQTRRMAARIDLTLGNGAYYPNWRAGYTNIAAGSSFVTSWAQSLPAVGSVVGGNLFHFVADDVTPAPFNQPPYPPAGDTCTDSCTVVGVAPSP